MSNAPRYLDGFLAAVHPGTNRAGPDPTPKGITPQEAVGPAAPAGPAASPPLPTEERIKHHLHPLDSFPRLLECAEADLPPGSDDRFRFEWFGLFYQAPRQDAFLLRLRLPGGRLTGFQLAGLACITQECAGGCVVLNGQGGLDVPGVPVRAAVETLRRVEEIGLSASRTGGDCVRSVRGGEYEGLADGDAREPVCRLVRTLEQALAHDRALSDLPRACEIIFRTPPEASGAGRDGPGEAVIFERGPGEHSFLLIPPGEKKGGFLLPAARVVPACLQLLQGWARETDRTDREKAGLAGFCATLGRERMEALFGPAKWQDAPAAAGWKPASRADPLPPGIHVPDGRLLSGQLAALERIVRERNLPGIRLADGAVHVVRGADESGVVARLEMALNGG